MSENCMFSSCRPSAKHRLVDDIFPKGLRHGESAQLNPAKINRLASFAVSYPKKLPDICTLLEARLHKYFSQGRVDYVEICVAAFRDLLLKSLELDLSHLVQPFLVNCCFLLLRSSSIHFVTRGANLFLEYTQLSERLDFSIFANPILELCNDSGRTTSAESVKMPIVGFKLLLRLIDMMLLRTAQLEAHMRPFLQILHHAIKSTPMAIAPSTNSPEPSPQVELDASVAKYAWQCLSLLASVSSPVTLAQLVGQIIELFETDRWLPSNIILDIFQVIQKSAAASSYNAPIVRTLFEHAEGLILKDIDVVEDDAITARTKGRRFFPWFGSTNRSLTRRADALGYNYTLPELTSSLAAVMGIIVDVMEQNKKVHLPTSLDVPVPISGTALEEGGEIPHFRTSFDDNMAHMLLVLLFVVLFANPDARLPDGDLTLLGGRLDKLSHDTSNSLGGKGVSVGESDSVGGHVEEQHKSLEEVLKKIWQCTVLLAQLELPVGHSRAAIIPNILRFMEAAESRIYAIRKVQNPPLMEEYTSLPMPEDVHQRRLSVGLERPSADAEAAADESSPPVVNHGRRGSAGSAMSEEELSTARRRGSGGAMNAAVAVGGAPAGHVTAGEPALDIVTQSTPMTPPRATAESRGAEHIDGVLMKSPSLLSRMMSLGRSPKNKDRNTLYAPVTTKDDPVKTTADVVDHAAPKPLQLGEGGNLLGDDDNDEDPSEKGDPGPPNPASQPAAPSADRGHPPDVVDNVDGSTSTDAGARRPKIGMKMLGSLVNMLTRSAGGKKEAKASKDEDHFADVIGEGQDDGNHHHNQIHHDDAHNSHTVNPVADGGADDKYGSDDVAKKLSFDESISPEGHGNGSSDTKEVLDAMTENDRDVPKEETTSPASKLRKARTLARLPKMFSFGSAAKKPLISSPVPPVDSSAAAAGEAEGVGATSRETGRFEAHDASTDDVERIVSSSMTTPLKAGHGDYAHDPQATSSDEVKISLNDEDRNDHPLQGQQQPLSVSRPIRHRRASGGTQSIQRVNVPSEELLRAEKIVSTFRVYVLYIVNILLANADSMSGASLAADALLPLNPEAVCHLCLLLSAHDVSIVRQAAGIILNLLDTQRSSRSGNTAVGLMVLRDVSMASLNKWAPLTFIQVALIRDAVFNTLCAVDAPVQSILSVWSIQASLLLTFGANEFVHGLPVMLALENFWRIFPLDFLADGELSTTTEMLGRQRVFFLAYLLLVARIFDCAPLKKIADKLLNAWKRGNLLAKSISIGSSANPVDPPVTIISTGIHPWDFVQASPMRSSTANEQAGVSGDLGEVPEIVRQEMLAALMVAGGLRSETLRIRQAFEVRYVPQENPFLRVEELCASSLPRSPFAEEGSFDESKFLSRSLSRSAPFSPSRDRVTGTPISPLTPATPGSARHRTSGSSRFGGSVTPTGSVASHGRSRISAPGSLRSHGSLLNRSCSSVSAGCRALEDVNAAVRTPGWTSKYQAAKSKYEDISTANSPIKDAASPKGVAAPDSLAVLLRAIDDMQLAQVSRH